jgi:predicted MPP superfamily phosphohydrolase
MTPARARHPITRRSFLNAGACLAVGVALYSSEIERHWIEISHRDVFLSGLHSAFDGLRIAQLSDIHFDEFTEPIFLREAVRRVNSLSPDMVFLTGDYVTRSPISRRIFKDAAWHCAAILNQLQCRLRYACLGNHAPQSSSGHQCAASGEATALRETPDRCRLRPSSHCAASRPAVTFPARWSPLPRHESARRSRSTIPSRRASNRL